MKRIFTLIILFCSLLILQAQTPSFAEKQASVNKILAMPAGNWQPRKRHMVIGSTVVFSLEKLHYAPRRMSPALSAEWYNNYFRLLDPGRNFFCQEDLESFRPYETSLWDPRKNLVNFSVAILIYQRYMERLKEKLLFYQQHYNDPMDYSIDETIPNLPLEEVQYQPNKAGLEKLWYKQLKNRRLILRLDRDGKLKKPDTNAEDKKDKNDPVKKTSELEERYLLVEDLAQLYKYRLEIESIDILELFLTALGECYDPHTCYMSPDSEEDFEINNINLSLEGIGATLSYKDSYTTVVELVPNAPAAKEGHLQPGDKIIAVAQDGKPPVNTVAMPLKKVVRMIRGPRKTTVHLTVKREGLSSPIQISIVRDKVDFNQEQGVKSTIRKIKLANGKNARVLIIDLPSFYRYTTRDTKRKIKEAQNAGKVDAVILDLRWNGGGLLDQAVELTGLFMRKAPVVQVNQTNSSTIVMKDEDSSITYEGPLAVLVNRGSASASEITAAALQDLGRAIILGEKTTHGKGTVQFPMNLNRFTNSSLPNFPSRKKMESGMLKFTMGKFYRITGDTTQFKGVTPDLIFPSYTDHMRLGEQQLPHALPPNKINGLTYRCFWKNVANVIPELRQKMLDRQKKSPEFQKYLQDIAFYDKIYNQKAIPLHYYKRIEYEKQLDIVNEMIKRFYSINSNKKKSEKDASAVQDIILEETLRVIQDWLVL